MDSLEILKRGRGRPKGSSKPKQSQSNLIASHKEETQKGKKRQLPVEEKSIASDLEKDATYKEEESQRRKKRRFFVEDNSALTNFEEDTVKLPEPAIAILENADLVHALPVFIQRDDFSSAITEHQKELFNTEIFRGKKATSLEMQLENSIKPDGTVKNQRNKDSVVHHGYYYWADGKDKSGRWVNLKCSKFSDGCTVRGKKWLLTGPRNGNLSLNSNQHNHWPQDEKINVMTKVHELKLFAKSHPEISAIDIAAMMGELPREEQAIGPKLKSMERTAQRQREDLENKMDDVRGFDISLKYQLNLSDSSWIQIDTGANDQDRIIGIASPEMVEKLADVKHFFIDGTFSVCPKSYYQLISIHGIVDYINDVPCTVALMYIIFPDKKKASYRKVMNLIQQKFPHFDPESWMMDFEQGIAKTIAEIFPQCEVAYCFFHFSQNIWRRIGEEHAITLYREGGSFKKLVRGFVALAFAKEEDVVRGFHLINGEFNDLSLDGPSERMKNYMLRTYIGHLNATGSRDEPMFPIHDWNVHDRTKNNLPRTNNHMEGFHSGFRKRFRAPKPSVTKFFQVKYNLN
jgi:hypothetical protein